MDILNIIGSFIYRLTDEQAGQLIKTACAYAGGVEMEAEDPMVAMGMEVVKNALSDRKKMSEMRSRCGSLGGAPKGNKNARKENKQKQAELDLVVLGKNTPCSITTGNKPESIDNQNSYKGDEMKQAKQAKVDLVDLVVFEEEIEQEIKAKEEQSPIDNSKKNIITPVEEKENKEKELPPREIPHKKVPHKRPMPNYDFSIVDRPELQDIFNEWLEYKHERNEDYKPRGFKACYTKLVNDSNGDPEVARRIILRAMGNNSMGFFPERPQTNYTKQDNGKVDTLNVNDRYDISKYDI